MEFDVSRLEDDQLRDLLVKISLEWERRFAVAPQITASIAEYDAAKRIASFSETGQPTF